LARVDKKNVALQKAFHKLKQNNKVGLMLTSTVENNEFSKIIIQKATDLRSAGRKGHDTPPETPQRLPKVDQ
jgi:hypothetical protein